MKDEKLVIGEAATSADLRQRMPEPGYHHRISPKGGSRSWPPGSLGLCRAENGKLKNVGFELLARGKELADNLKTEVAAVCFDTVWTVWKA